MKHHRKYDAHQGVYCKKWVECDIIMTFTAAVVTSACAAPHCEHGVIKGFIVSYCFVLLKCYFVSICTRCWIKRQQSWKQSFICLLEMSSLRFSGTTLVHRFCFNLKVIYQYTNIVLDWIFHTHFSKHFRLHDYQFTCPDEALLYDANNLYNYLWSLNVPKGGTHW